MKFLHILVGLVVAIVVFTLVFNGLNYVGNMLVHHFVAVLDSEFGRNMIALKTLVSFVGAVYMGRNVYRHHMLSKTSLKKKETIKTTGSDEIECK